MATLIQTLQNVLDAKDPYLAMETKRILLKEVLQAYVLDYLYNHSNYRHLNFYGGTCLHMIYGLNRLSEDLDFDNTAGVEIRQLPADLASHFHKTFGYTEASTKVQESAGESAWPGIYRVTLRFPLLNALGLSPHSSEALHLKVEVSQHRQTAVIQRTPVLVHGRSLVARHFSLESMMAGKMIACLERNLKKGNSGVHIKGRDFYDLLWFMQQNIHPLEEKLAKDGGQPYTTLSAMLTLQEKIAGIKTHDLALDLLPMFESRTFIEAWLDAFQQTFDRLVAGYLGE